MIPALSHHSLTTFLAFLVLPNLQNEGMGPVVSAFSFAGTNRKVGIARITSFHLARNELVIVPPRSNNTKLFATLSPSSLSSHSSSQENQTSRQWAAPIPRTPQKTGDKPPTRNTLNFDCSTRAPTKSFNSDVKDSSSTWHSAPLQSLLVSQVTLVSFCVALVFVFPALLSHAHLITGDATISTDIWVEWARSSPSLYNLNFPVWATVLGTIGPMILWASFVGKLPHQGASHAQFSTTNLVMTLFGRRRGHPKFKTSQLYTSVEQPSVPNSVTAVVAERSTFTTLSTSQAVFLSVILAILTSVTEEIIFRGCLPTALYHLSDHSFLVAWVGQALAFGLSHVHAGACSDKENHLVASTQMLWGLVYGVLLAVSHGDPRPGMIVHALYDTHILASTWHTVNTQMDWTEQNLSNPQRRLEDSKDWNCLVQEVDSGADKDDAKQKMQWCRQLFYAFDTDHALRLSLENTQRALMFATLFSDHRSASSSQHDVRSVFNRVLQCRDQGSTYSTGDSPDVRYLGKQDKRIDFAEFLSILFTLGSQPCPQAQYR